MARYLLLHGAGGIGFDHWLVWLSDALRSRGHSARMRKLPHPRAPRRAPWHAAMVERLATLEAERSATAGGGNDDELVVVAHSLSTLLWLLYAQDVTAGRIAPPARRVDRVALITPPKLPDEVGDSGWAMPDPTAIDPATVAASTRVAVSRNDRYWPNGAAIDALVTPLGLPLDDLGDAGHTEPADGYGPWPSLLAWCLGEATTIAANQSS